MPFDRLVRAVDQWAEKSPGFTCFAQIGETVHKPLHIESASWLDSASYTAMIQKCDAIVAHAGTGTILHALECRKPLLVLPREYTRHETRNDHQIDTAKYFESQGYLLAAYNVEQLFLKLDQLKLFKPKILGSGASEDLIRQLSEFAAPSQPTELTYKC